MVTVTILFVPFLRTRQSILAGHNIANLLYCRQVGYWYNCADMKQYRSAQFFSPAREYIGTVSETDQAIQFES
jgi:hypothetical protein